MMKKRKAENIAYIVPTVIIDSFLEDIKDGTVNGFSKESTFYHSIENDTLKEFYGLKNGNGVLVSTVDKYNDKIKLNDIILTEYGRISFSHIFNIKQIGEGVVLNILRDKKLIKVKQTIKRIPNLVEYEFAKNPRYIIFGGLVFTPITKNYLSTLSKLESVHINKKLYSKNKSAEYQEAISMIPTVFPHEVNRGYKNWASVLKSVNGVKIKSFNHLVSVLDNTNE